MHAQPGCQRLGCSTVRHIEAHVHLWKEPALRGALQGWTGGSQVAPAQGTVLFLHRALPQQRDNTCTIDAYQCTSPAAGARPRTCRPAAAARQSGPAHRLTPAGWRRQQEGVAFMLGVCGSRSCRGPRESAGCTSGVGAGRALQCPRRRAAPPPAASGGGRAASPRQTRPSAQPRRQLWPCQSSRVALTGLQGAGWPCRTPL
jgi:hypothetical protein